MNSETKDSQMELKNFLSRHQPFGSWRDEWLGIPLEFRSCAAEELPPREYVGSVRAVVLRDNEVLVVYTSPPILSVGGRCEPGETLEETLLREVGEETGWLVAPIGVIGFVHGRHLDEQRPAWGRPAPDFIDPIFAVTAVRYDPAMLGQDEVKCQFIPIDSIEPLGIERINRTFLSEALRRRSKNQSL
jgi:8-oxo-dGTP pyrophosphatase MutT (NUDIX family)